MNNFENTAKLLKDYKFLLKSESYYLSDHYIRSFEEKTARILSVKHVIAVSSGTAALHCAFRALNLQQGDEILVPAVSVIMSVAPIIYQNARPVFVDCGSDTIDFDYDDLISKITPKTKAVLAVYLWGCSYDLNKLQAICREYNLLLIEDVCQAMGSKWQNKYLGGFGELGCFSLKDGKIISSGEGGFIATNNDQLAEKCRLLRSHYFHSDPKLKLQEIGYNYRLSELQAVLANHQITLFTRILARRQAQTRFIYEQLANFPGLHEYQYFPAETANLYSPIFILDGHKFDLSKAGQYFQELSQNEVLNSIGSYGLNPVYRKPSLKKYSTTDLKNAEKLLSQLLAIIIFPNYTKQKLRKIVKNVKKITSKYLLR